MKKKGSRVERELVELFWSNGFAALRTPGSGVSTYPCPDVIASNGKKTLALEVKYKANLPIYIQTQRINDLLTFSKIFGATPLIAVKLPRKDWKFIKIDDLKRTKNGYKVDSDVLNTSADFDEIVGKSIQKRLNV